MRIEIKTKDRLGISQEILSVFADNKWNVSAVEVVSHFVYVQLLSKTVSLLDISEAVECIADVTSCREVELLPTQRRESHLQALLDKIPEPILDIDQTGIIVALNQAAKLLTESEGVVLEGQHISNHLDHSFESLQTNDESSFSVTFQHKPYLADVTRITTEHRNSGLVLTLRSLNSIGKQIALMQTRDHGGIDSIIGNSKIIKTLKEQTVRFSELDLPILINGETGTGKELFARALHNLSTRSAAPFLAINCASLPENLLESELFGYVSGAFTGAQKGGKPGLFELAEGGSVFLDEIAEMSIYLQAKLLRFLQDYKFRRLGGTQEITANVRIISATHQNLHQQISKNLFREDLYYRLNVLTLVLPALHERVEDIKLLTLHFIQAAAVQIDQHTPSLSENALKALERCSWPGNIRQLQNTLFRAVALNNNNCIEESDIAVALAQFTPDGLANKNTKTGQSYGNEELFPASNISGQEKQELDESDIVDWLNAQENFEKNLLSSFYEKYPSTRKLAERLNVSHNKIAMKLRKYGITKRLK